MSNSVRHLTLSRLALSGACALGACQGNSNAPLPSSMRLSIPAAYDASASRFQLDLAASSLSERVDNPLFPALPGAAWTYLASTSDGVERTEVRVEAEPRDVWGTRARVSHDSLYLDDQLVEDTRDWFAQDQAGNVWYLGEDTAQYSNGQVVDRDGAWEAGVAGALPGVQMLAAPEVGDAYRQEYLPGQAEDVGQVISLTESVSVPAGSWSGCLETRDRSVIEPDANEYKYYCPGVGLVLEVEGDTRVELSEYSGL